MFEFEIVVVSSSLAVRRHVADILFRLGFDALSVATLRECRTILGQKAVGLIFCEAVVSDGNYKDLLAAYPNHKPRVVVMSPSADWQEFSEAMGVGAFDVISEPPRARDVEWMLIQARRLEHQVEQPVALTASAAARR